MLNTTYSSNLQQPALYQRKFLRNPMIGTTTMNQGMLGQHGIHKVKRRIVSSPGMAAGGLAATSTPLVTSGIGGIGGFSSGYPTQISAGPIVARRSIALPLLGLGALTFGGLLLGKFAKNRAFGGRWGRRAGMKKSKVAVGTAAVPTTRRFGIKRYPVGNPVVASNVGVATTRPTLFSRMKSKYWV